MTATLRHLARRLLRSLALVVGAASLAFLVARTLPGDPVRMLVGPQASPADVARARQVYALDRPLGTQYVRFWTRLVHPANAGTDHKSCSAVGPAHIDLGMSYRSRKGVAALLASKAPNSLALALAAVFVQLVLGCAVGTYAAHRRGRLPDEVSIAAAMVAVSAPTFLLGVALQYVLAHRLRLLPLDGSSGDLRGLVLPALTLGLYGSALYARMARDELGRALESGFAASARARGASSLRVLLVHAWRSAMNSMLSLAMLELGGLVGGAVVTEKLFRWPGLGALTVDAVVNRDAPVLFGTVLLSAAAIAVTSLLIDTVEVVLDPRLRK
jgi:peptide/nickel transport system permease protein